MGEGRIDAELAIVCHTDTVPFSAEWAQATELRERDGMLHGCGACDVKGFLACMLAAVSSMNLGEMRERLCLVFTADEEVGCRGLASFLSRTLFVRGMRLLGSLRRLLPRVPAKAIALRRSR
ncbi:M20/M25/M40 family metallo-hydrolase [Tunturiibacter gelidiferens]|uniref:M20/M25/M40 family metallo-hydrolase n=1 Tax=Tunturiibacter gelidiferens TaxID=3069689 RepID=UPI003D9B92EB